MIHAENILVALAAPLMVALVFNRSKGNQFVVFFILGLVCCLLAAYINNFFALAGNMDARMATLKLTPISEEIMKALPILFYMAALQPKREDLIPAAIAVGVGFATFENCIFLIQNGEPDLSFALIRGFAAGVMHASCAVMLGYGLALLRERKHLLVSGVFGLLCLVSVYHASYNLMVSSPGAWQTAGYVMPMCVAVAIKVALSMIKTI